MTPVLEKPYISVSINPENIRFWHFTNGGHTRKSIMAAPMFLRIKRFILRKYIFAISYSCRQKQNHFSANTHSFIKNWQSYIIFELYKRKVWRIPAGWREAVNQTRTDKSMLKRKKDKQLSCFRYLCLFSCGGVQHILCCWFFLRLVYPMFPVYLHCPQHTVVSTTDNPIYFNCIKKNM